MSKKIERKVSFKSISGDDLKDFYTPSNNEKNYNIDPGSFPYTRGIHKNTVSYTHLTLPTTPYV